MRCSLRVPSAGTYVLSHKVSSPKDTFPCMYLSFSVTLIGLVLQTLQRTSVPTRQPASTGMRRVPQLSYTGCG